MAKILYTFSDGHQEEIEVTEEFKAAYEFELAREKARYWKQYRQKERAGIPTGHDWSLDKMTDDGIDYAAKGDPLSVLIEKEQREETNRKKTEELKKILSCLTEKQREAYVLFYIHGYRKVAIAVKLHISEKAVRKRLIAANKKITKSFRK